MSLSMTCIPYHFPRGCRVLLLEGRVLPGQVTSSSQGPHWWAMWGSVSRSRTLRHAAQPCPEPGFEPATFRSLVDLLYPLSYSQELRFSTWLLRGSRACNVAFVWTTMIPLINYFRNALPIPVALLTVTTIVTCAPEPITAHHSHVRTRANHCRAHFHDIP